MELIPVIREKVDRLFEFLEERTGIVAEQNWTCCLSCGIAAMQKEHPGKPYVFYHAQDNETWYNPNRKILLVEFSDYSTAADFCNAALDIGIELDWSGRMSERIGLVVRQ